MAHADIATLKAVKDIFARVDKLEDWRDYEATEEEEKVLLGVIVQAQKLGIKDPGRQRRAARTMAMARMLGQLDEDGEVKK